MRIEANTVTGFPRGISLTGTSCLVLRNLSGGNTNNYVNAPGGSIFGDIVTTEAAFNAAANANVNVSF